MSRLDNVNARVGARRSRLIGPEGLRELLVRPTVEGRIELLVRTGRLAAAPAAPEKAQLTAVEAALRAAVRADEARLVREVEGARARRLLTAALGLEEAQALKVLLRGTARGVAPDRLVAMASATAGALPEERLRSLASAPSPEALATRLATEGSPFAAALEDGLRERDRAGLLSAEVAIDRVAFARVASEAREAGEDAAGLLEWLAIRADVRNATTLLALGVGVPARDLFVQGGGRLGASAFARLAREPPEVRRAAVAALVPCGAERLADPSAAERILARAAVGRLTLAARRRPLSLAVPLAWIEARRDEVRRIAVVLRGAALELPGDSILDLVEA